VAALWLFVSRRYAVSGLMVALGAGLKLYPALFVPPLFVVAWRERKAKPFLFGLIGGGMPILLLGLVLPWWRFLSFNTGRGLQAESLYASSLWLAHLSGLTEAKWEGANGCQEVHGALADTILPWTRAWFALAVGISTALSCRSAARLQGGSVAALARHLLVPLLAFVIFNQVFSPQYMIWLLPFAAMASAVGNPLIPMAIPLATVLIPIFFPSPEYLEGLNLPHTLALVARNLILVGAWVFLVRELLQLLREDGRDDHLKP
jgi:hypothetical protein